MRRRTDSRAPERLRTYTPQDWPGDETHADPCWVAAREAWHAEHGWPGGEVGWEGAQIDAAIVTPDEPWPPR